MKTRSPGQQLFDGRAVCLSGCGCGGQAGECSHAGSFGFGFATTLFRVRPKRKEPVTAFCHRMARHPNSDGMRLLIQEDWLLCCTAANTLPCDLWRRAGHECDCRDQTSLAARYPRPKGRYAARGSDGLHHAGCTPRRSALRHSLWLATALAWCCTVCPRRWQVTMEMMLLHGQSVARGLSKAMMVIDMPFGAYEEGREQAFRNASRLMSQTGASAVKRRRRAYGGNNSLPDPARRTGHGPCRTDAAGGQCDRRLPGARPSAMTLDAFAMTRSA